MKKIILLMIILLIPLVSAYYWHPDSRVTAQIARVNNFNSAPTVFYNLLSSKWALVSGNQVGTFVGYMYNGSNWTINSTVIKGLTDVGSYSKPMIFYNLTGDNTWGAIVGNWNTGAFNGFTWNGTTWTANSTIISGLTITGQDQCPFVFYNFSGNEKWNLIYGESGGSFYGFIWNGTGWKANTTITNGLTNIGSSSSPTVSKLYEENDTWALISGTNSNGFVGFLWNGTSWKSNSSIVYGINSASINRMRPMFIYNFTGDGKTNLIVGVFTGDFYGYTYMPNDKKLSFLIGKTLTFKQGNKFSFWR